MKRSPAKPASRRSRISPRGWRQSGSVVQTWHWVAISLLLVNAAAVPGLTIENSRSLEHRRLPAAMAIDPAGERLFVANESSGSMSVITTSEPHIVTEWPIGQRLADVVVVPSRNLVLTVDTQQHLLRAHRWQDDRLVHIAEIQVPAHPVQLQVDASGSRIAVSSLWARQVSLWQLTEGDTFEPLWVQDLDFAPHHLQFVHTDATLIVADAFGGHLAAVQVSDGQLLRDRVIPAHKIRGLNLTPDGQRLIVSHQMLNGLAHAIRNDVHWGLMMSNDLRWLDLEVLLSSDENFHRQSHMHPLGQPGAGMADPAGIALSSQGVVAVAVQGVDRVLMGVESDFSLRSISVGPGPVDLVFSPEGQRLYVAHRWDDSVSIIDVEDRDPVARISLGPTPEETLVERGRRLFHEARLAHDGWMSCASCHVDGHTNGHLNDNFSDDSFGAPKRVLTLLGVHGTEPLAWNGSKDSLETQVKASLEATMQSPNPPQEEDIAAISAFVRSLTPPPSISQARHRSDAPAEARGAQLFSNLGCRECHAGDQLTSPRNYDVGLIDEQGNREFNPPSLLGISQRPPYFHDARAQDLEAVIDQVRHQLTRDLSSDERADLLAYLRSL